MIWTCRWNFHRRLYQLYKTGRRGLARAQSDRIIERLEQATGLSVLADGFPEALVDDEPEEVGYEVRPEH